MQSIEQQLRLAHKCGKMDSLHDFFPFKVRLDPDEMIIMRDDTRFATFHPSTKYEYFDNNHKAHFYASPSSRCEETQGSYGFNFTENGLDLKTTQGKLVQIQLTTGRRYALCERPCTVCSPQSALYLFVKGCHTTKKNN